MEIKNFVETVLVEKGVFMPTFFFKEGVDSWKGVVVDTASEDELDVKNNIKRIVDSSALDEYFFVSSGVVFDSKKLSSEMKKHASLVVDGEMESLDNMEGLVSLDEKSSLAKEVFFICKFNKIKGTDVEVSDIVRSNKGVKLVNSKIINSNLYAKWNIFHPFQISL